MTESREPDSGGLVDPPRDLRAEDAFDTDRLTTWLQDRGLDVAGTPIVRQFPGGASNLTYLLSYPERDLILRRPPAAPKRPLPTT